MSWLREKIRGRPYFRGPRAPRAFITGALVRCRRYSHTNRRGSLPRWRILACLSFNAAARGLCPKMVRREGKQPEVIMMRAMAIRWTRAAIAHFPKIIDRLLHFGVLRGINRKLRHCRRNIVRRPMIPSAGRRVGSSHSRTKLRVPSGAPDHCRGGERFSPSQVNRRGIAAPASKAA